MNNQEMSSQFESTHFGKTLGPSLVDAFAEFWHGGEGPSHDVIDRKIAAAGLQISDGSSKARKIIAAFMAANDHQAYVLMDGLLDALRRFSKGPYSSGALDSTDAGSELRKAIESAGYSLNEHFELSSSEKEPGPVVASTPQSSWSRPLPPKSDAPGQRVPAVTQVTTQEKVAIHQAEVGKSAPKEMFLVHGHDDHARLEVSNWVRELTGVTPIILRDQLNRGKTLIEKFESYSLDTACAIVLMTPDDEARAKREPNSDLLSQARQNVVFELGYFYGRLKRENVIVLNFGVELPGDINGLVYIGKDKWEVELGKELAGLGYSAHL